jgi:ribbon-helix-helix CopG family protein
LAQSPPRGTTSTGRSDVFNRTRIGEAGSPSLARTGGKRDPIKNRNHTVDVGIVKSKSFQAGKRRFKIQYHTIHQDCLCGDITSAKLISVGAGKMIRIVISLDEESKKWLDQQAREENISAAELIRTAVRKYRDEKRREALPLKDLLNQTSGIWKRGDGLTYQRRLRKEWQK